VTPGTRILLVDDNVELAANVGEILESEGAVVTHASTAKDGIALARSPFDVALVDIRLPDGTGLELLPKLRAISGPTPEILLITGDATLEDAIEAVKAGAYDYIVKPFDPLRLIATVQHASNLVHTKRQTSALARQLAEREENLRTLVGTVQVMLLTLTEEGIINSANPATERHLGRGERELVGRSLSDFVPVREHEELHNATALVSGGTPAGFDTRITTAGPNPGPEYRIRWQWMPLRHEDGTIEIYASGLDVTELANLERRTRLSEKLAAVGTLAAGLAHEIRNPLNAAELQLQLMARRINKLSLPDAMRQKSDGAIDAVRVELGRLTRLVEDFLNFARPTQLRTSKVEMCQFFHQLHDFVAPAASAAETVLAVHTPDSPLYITADAERLKQVFLNIINNATRAAGSGGQVQIRVEADGTAIRVTISDTGPGIADEDLPRVFEPFYTTADGGTGLGMAITHSIVSLHGGDIELRNDQGLHVDVTLPAEPPLPHAKRPASGSFPTIPLAKIADE
jgi:PAS domain S-box-containing protein